LVTHYFVFTAFTQAVVKAMDQLAHEGKIKEKVYGKQKIYFADQVGVIPFYKRTSVCESA